jgi:hypothetical protein
LVGILALFLSNDEQDITLPVLFFIWTAASVFAALTGIRFTLLLVAPIGIGIGITLGFLYNMLVEWMSSSFHIKRFITGIILFILFSLILIAPVSAGISTAKNYIPNVDDQWWNDLTNIKDNSNKDAILNSWWDFGHWFKYIADRGVTLDGSSQNSPQLHWLGKILLTSDDREARGILRMLDCGANEAFDNIDKKINNSLESKRLLDKIIVLERDDAKKVLLENGFSDSEAESVLNLSHCNPPEDFFITSEDMVGKGGVWAHFGSWSFDRAWIHQVYDNSNSQEEFVQKVTKELNISDAQAKEYYNQIINLNDDRAVNDWIAPWPSYIQGEAACQNSSGLITCSLNQQRLILNVIVNATTMEASVPTADGTKYIDVFGYTTDDGLEVKEYANNNLGGIGMLLIRSKDGYSCVFMSPQLVNSTFTKLYYLDGHGTMYFDAFSSTTGMNGFKSKVWKVNWYDSGRLIVSRLDLSASSNASVSDESIGGNFTGAQDSKKESAAAANSTAQPESSSTATTLPAAASTSTTTSPSTTSSTSSTTTSTTQPNSTTTSSTIPESGNLEINIS